MAAKDHTKSAKKEIKGEESEGLWVDATLIGRLHGHHSPGLKPTLGSESERLLHYADVALGTDEKEKFVSSRPIKDRKKL